MAACPDKIEAATKDKIKTSLEDEIYLIKPEERKIKIRCSTRPYDPDKIAPHRYGLAQLSLPVLGPRHR